MHLTPREVDQLIIFTTGEVARRRQPAGEAQSSGGVALIAAEALVLIRDGKAVAEIHEHLVNASSARRSDGRGALESLSSFHQTHE
jgi:urease gamma subunit